MIEQAKRLRGALEFLMLGGWIKQRPDAFKTAVAAACGGSLLILLILTNAINTGFEDTARLRQLAAESYEARALLQAILSRHQDLELGQRGYVLSADPEFLEPYENASRDIDTYINKYWARASMVQRAQVQALRRASAKKRYFASRTIAMVEQGRKIEAENLIAKGDDKRAMDRVRALVDEMSRTEEAILAQRVADAEQSRIRVRQRTISLEIGLISLLAIAGLIIIRSQIAREKVRRTAHDMAVRQEAIFDCSKDGFIVLNPSGSIESLNPAAAAMFGFASQELLRRDIGLLFEVAPERGEVETFLQRLHANNKPSYGRIQEFAAKRRDGSIFPLEVLVSPVHLAEKTLFLAALRDISDRREIEHIKSEFVATVSHELRTPLTSIAGSLGLINGGAAGEVSPKVGRLVEIAHSNAARLVRLINDILDIEKIEAGRMPFDIRPLPLAPLIAEVIEQSQGFANQYGVRLKVEPIHPSAAVMADEDRLVQVVTNLLSNAIKFSSAGDDVCVAVTSLDRRQRISVRDHGTGVPEAFRATIFDKFAQADTSDTRKKGGTGLGLSIVREIVVRLGGAIYFESVEGEGSVFYVDLPATSPSEIALPFDDDGQAEQRLPLLLHLEDDPDMQALVASAFHRRAAVHRVSTVAKARQAIFDGTYAAVILDISVSDGSGLQLVKLLRQRNPGTPVIVFTAQDIEGGLQDQIDVALVKSRASLDRLVSVVMERVGTLESVSV